MGKKGRKLLVLLSLTMIMIIGSMSAVFAFSKGADISWVPGMEAQGYRWKDKNGWQRDILDILKWDYQINHIRIRVFVNPSNDYGNGYMNMYRAADLAKRAKDMGMNVMLTLHYSDSWADPGKQYKPAAWSSYDFNGLMNAVWSYTRDVVLAMRNKGVTPTWIQTGNETNDGMLWEDGRASRNMRNYAWLVNCGYNGVKETNSSIRTVVHLSSGQDNSLFRWNFDGLRNNGAMWDIIGASLYPSASDYRTQISQLKSNFNDMKSRYGKDVLVCEIGMDYHQESAAKDFVNRVKNEMRSIGALGVFYWEPQATPGYNAGYNKGAWRSDMRPTIALEGFID